MIGAISSNRPIAVGTLALAVAFLFFVPVSTASASTIAELFGNVTFWLAVYLGGMVLSFGALVLDIAIYHLVIDMGSYFTADAALGGAISLGWSLVRDLINITFIFGLIYIGIKTILNSEDSTTRRQLGYLIVAALLINFSLFITQLMVDFSNLLSTQVYIQLVDGQGPTGNASEEANSPIAAKFLSAVKLSSFFSIGSISDANNFRSNFEGNLFWFSIVMFFFFVFAGISFFLGAILILTRFVALLLFMIFSPVMFLGWILPWFRSYSSYWWSSFFRYAFFAPIYIMLIFLSVHILSGLVATTGGADNTTRESVAHYLGQRNLTEGLGQTFLHFGVMIGLLWASLKIGDKMSIAGSSIAMGGMGMVQGFMYRNSVGRGLNFLINQGDKTNMMPESVRRMLVKGRDIDAGGIGWSQAEKDTMTARNRRIQRDSLSGLDSSIIAGIQDGADSETIIAMETKLAGASGKDIVEMAKSPSMSRNLIAGADRLSESQVKSVMDSDDVSSSTKRALGAKRAELVAKRVHSSKGGITKADGADLKAMGYEVALEHAGKLTDKQISDWKELTPTQKQQLYTKREKALEDEVKTPEGAKAIFERFKKGSDIASLPKGVLKNQNSGQYLADTSVLSKIAEKEGLSPKDRADIKQNMYHAVQDQDQLQALDTWFDRDSLGRRFKT